MLGLCCFDQRDPVLYLLMLSEKDEYTSVVPQEPFQFVQAQH